MRFNSDRGHYVGFAVADMSHGFPTLSRRERGVRELAAACPGRARAERGSLRRIVPMTSLPVDGRS
jgi:hypothetical protein